MGNASEPMDDRQVRVWAMDMLGRLGTSKFRAGFTLSAKDRTYALSRGETVIREHARDLLAKRIGPANPARDGKQTPFRGHPVFTAQHATATCCRGCLYKWHHIPKGRPLTDTELSNLTELVIRWIRRDLAREAREEAGTMGVAASGTPASGTNLDQHFLQNPEKIDRIVAAAEVLPGDHVVELGAGIGSVAARIPEVRSLTLVELDTALCTRLARRFVGTPQVHVINGDALEFLKGIARSDGNGAASKVASGKPAASDSEPCDVIFSNLPHTLTPRVFEGLARARFRTALVTVREGEDLSRWEDRLAIEPIELLEEQDFSPAQPFNSLVVRVRPLR